MWELEGRERLRIDGENLNQLMKRIRGIHMMELDQLMVNYICDNNINNENEIKAIRGFLKYIKEN